MVPTQLEGIGLSQLLLLLFKAANLYDAKKRPSQRYVTEIGQGKTTKKRLCQTVFCILRGNITLKTVSKV